MWEKVKLKKLVSEGGIFIDGDWIESKDQDQNGEIRLIQLADIGVGKFIDKSSRFMTKENASKLKCTFLKKGDILIARMPDPIGRCCVFPLDKDEKYVTVVDVAILRPNNENVSTRFLQHYINSDDFQSKITPNVTGTTRQRISRGKLENLEIPLPPLPFQEKIAEILDKADELRRKDKDLQAKYDELAQALFIDMFGDPVKNEKGWEVKKLEEVTEVGSSRRVFVDELVESGIPFYRGTEIGELATNNSVIPSLFISKEHYEKLKLDCGVPQKGDLLLPSICPDGRIWVVDNSNEFYYKDGRVLHIKIKSNFIDSIYLKNHLKYLFLNNYTKIASGTTFAELKIFILKNIEIQIPPIHLQEAFAKKIELINQLKAQTNAEKSEELFQSLLQKAFKGELTID